MRGLGVFPDCDDDNDDDGARDSRGSRPGGARSRSSSGGSPHIPGFDALNGGTFGGQC